jgi:hypothetical protein
MRRVLAVLVIAMAMIGCGGVRATQPTRYRKRGLPLRSGTVAPRSRMSSSARSFRRLRGVCALREATPPGNRTHDSATSAEPQPTTKPPVPSSMAQMKSASATLVAGISRLNYRRPSVDMRCRASRQTPAAACLSGVGCRRVHPMKIPQKAVFIP